MIYRFRVVLDNDTKEDIFREFTPEITKYMFPKAPEKIEETIEFINSKIVENNEKRSC